MIKDKIDDLIKENILKKDIVRVLVYRALKTAFTEQRTAKNAKPLDEVGELNLIKKLVSMREEAANEYLKAKCNDRAAVELAEAKILKEFLPAEISKEELTQYANEIVTEKGMSNMGKYMKLMKDKYPTADGKVISDIIKKLLS